MIKKSVKQSGFTAVELLITLFVAAAFLIAAYQLFNLVVKDGGATRAESRAANVAYDYLRRYGASSTTIPCTASTPLTAAPVSIDGLTSVTISITVSCLPNAISSLSKVDAVISYNNPVQTVEYATYISSSGNSSSAGDITNGLVAWWKLNGDTNNSIGSPNGVNNNATSTSNQAGQQNMAYSFDGTSSNISASSTYGLGAANVSLSCWVYIPSTSDHGMFIHVGQSPGYGIGVGNTTTETVGNKLIMIYEGVRWIPTTASIGTGWHHVVMVIDGSGVPTAYLDGVSVGSYAGATTATPTSGVLAIGAIPGTTLDNFAGSIDDVRLYNRALPLSDILALYSNGAK